MAKIVLEINGEKKVFTSQPKKAKVVREGFELLDKINQTMNLELFDNVAAYMSEVFDCQFTAEQYIDGSVSESYEKEFAGVIGQLLGRVQTTIPNE